ncbi:zinc ribbon domain-containing protein [candidate division WOR-3 bacterium]|nr:zinc ribbon domain-containing protein [candidate division WOR-3 bacterium]
MPVYEYSCDDCGHKFDIVATLAEKEAGLTPVCPNCGGRKVHQVFGRFTVVGGSKGEVDFDEGIDEDIGDNEELGEDMGGLDEDFGDEDNLDENDEFNID